MIAMLNTELPRVDLQMPQDCQPVSECYRVLCERLTFISAKQGPLQVIGVTSCTRGEGVSTVALNLATAMAIANIQQRLLLVDGNLLRPASRRWHVSRQLPGLAELLLKRCDIKSAVHGSSLGNLSILPAGPASRSFAKAADFSALPAVIMELRQQFDVLVFDLPPADQAALAIPQAKHVEGLILVVEAERLPRAEVLRTKRVFEEFQLPLLGVVLNKRREHVPAWLRGWL